MCVCGENIVLFKKPIHNMLPSFNHTQKNPEWRKIWMWKIREFSHPTWEIRWIRRNNVIFMLKKKKKWYIKWNERQQMPPPPPNMRHSHQMNTTALIGSWIVYEMINLKHTNMIVTYFREGRIYHTVYFIQTVWDYEHGYMIPKKKHKHNITPVIQQFNYIFIEIASF